MKRTLTLLAALLVTPVQALNAAETPIPESPTASEIVYVPHPHFRWKREVDVRIDEIHRVQIARDEKFTDIVCDDSLEVVSRFVPVKALPPGSYWWRVRRGEGTWSESAHFTVRTPERAFTISAGSDSAAVARVFQQVATKGPARVDFEPGDYHLVAQDWKGVAQLSKAQDVIVNGHGARVVLTGTFLGVFDCQRVTLQNFHFTGEKAGHTLVRVLKIDPAKKELLVKPEAGYDPDIPRFFGGQGFLNRVDPECRGRHLGGFISTEKTTAKASPELPGAYVISPASDDALRRQEVGGLAVITRYSSPFVVMKHSDECTFDNVTLVDWAGAFCGGDATSAKSYLNCKVQCRTPGDYQGGHAAVGDGRVGEWIEGCEFNMLADDGPNVRTMRMKIAQADGDQAIVLAESWTNCQIVPGDTVALVNPQDFRAGTAEVKRVSAERKNYRLEIDGSLAAMGGQIGASDWHGVFFYRINPSCEDFVYRHNRHVGGRGHGVKFNGVRAWIADNHFENITGNAIEIGYSWQQAFEGHGASDVVISGNSILHCGWSPISSHSPTSLGGNFIIRDNRITEVRDAAIALKNCQHVMITGNEFASESRPSQGAWITIEKATDVRTSGNKYTADVPEIRRTSLAQ